MVSEPSMADSSTSNGPHSQLPLPNPPSPLLLLSNMSNLMSIKLDSVNYIVWKLQLTTILEAYSMIDHIDGSVPKPSQYLVDADGSFTTGANPSFLSWKKRDKALLTLIYSTLSPPVLSMVVGLNSAQEGLPKEYSSFNSAIRTMDDSLTFEKLSVLQTEELSINESSDMNTTLAMFVSNTNKHNSGNSNYHRGRGRNFYSKGGRGGGRYGNSYLQSQNQYSQNQFSQGSQGSQPAFNGQNPNSLNKPEHTRPVCQICGKIGHYAIDCYHRMDFAYQGKNPPTKLAAMANASNLNITQGNNDTWLTDSGASDHITANLNNLNQPIPFKGPEQVSVGNGQNLPIQNIGKMHKLPFPISVPKSEFPLHVLHANLWGPAPIQSYNGFKYYLVIVDDYTKFCWVYLLKNKSDTFTTFQQFKAMAEKHYNSSIHFLRTDCGGEFTSTAFNSYCATSGIIHHLTCPHTPQQNGVAERKHRHLIQTTLALLSQSGLSLSYWSYALATASHLINKLPTPLLNMSSPWEQLHHSPAPNSAAPQSPAPNSTASQSPAPLSAITPAHVPNSTETPAPAPNSAVPHSPAPIFAAPAQPSPLSAPIQNTHPMQTRSKHGIFKPKTCYKAQLDYTLIEPPSFKLATQISQWCQAMQDEYDALIRQGTWSLVPPPQHHNIVGCKWVYKLKTHSDGSIARYKARLVAKGFHQQQGIDFDETFSPVIKPPTVRMILSLAVSLNWPLRQLDVSNAFLHGILKEEVYMSQPQGYISAQHPDYVCRLYKSIYGLKQAPRAWFERFTGQLIQFGFTASAADSSLFIYRSKTIIAYLLLYVDDIVLTSNTPNFLDTLIQHLSSIFELKDLGSLHYFLGIQKLHDPHAYRSLVEALHYLTFTRPDLSFAVHWVCQYMASPTSVHLTVAKRILRYLKGTLHLGLSFRPGPLKLSAFMDADWAAKKQLTVSRSSTESEYRALALASIEVCWLRTLLKDLGVFISEAPILWCDNISALAIASNPVFHARTKHIEVDFHFVRERVLGKDLAVKFVSTLDQLADIFTKSLPAHRFLDLRSNLMATVRPPELEEGC
uniref:Integrase catalytic domain-containing protein n=1 Tax=Fagus sylvatica TaxID=28930 RepID=A0A2N9EEC7_FAGSY